MYSLYVTEKIIKHVLIFAISLNFNRILVFKSIFKHITLNIISELYPKNSILKPFLKVFFLVVLVVVVNTTDTIVRVIPLVIVGLVHQIR